MKLCVQTSDVRAFFFGVIMLFMEIYDLSHSDEDIALVEIAVKSGFKVGIFEE